MSRGSIVGILSVVVLLVTLFATVGPAARALGDGAAFLWPMGVVAILGVACAEFGLAAWRSKARLAATGSRASLTEIAEQAPSESGTKRERREVAYQRILSTSEAYINAHREASGFDEPGINIYIPELEEANHRVDRANINFVAARQLIEQYGLDPILEAVLAIENAVNEGHYDEAAQIRRDRLVPAVRKDMNRPTATFF
jgi:hypothetical protein